MWAAGRGVARRGNVPGHGVVQRSGGEAEACRYVAKRTRHSAQCCAGPCVERIRVLTSDSGEFRFGKLHELCSLGFTYFNLRSSRVMW